MNRESKQPGSRVAPNGLLRTARSLIDFGPLVLVTVTGLVCLAMRVANRTFAASPGMAVAAGLVGVAIGWLPSLFRDRASLEVGWVAGLPLLLASPLLTGGDFASILAGGLMAALSISTLRGMPRNQVFQRAKSDLPATEDCRPPVSFPFDAKTESSSASGSEDAKSGEPLEGCATIHFAAGQKQFHLHLPFRPPLSALPDLECDADDESVRLKVALIRTWGARIECRRRDAAEPAVVEIYYRAAGHSAVQRAA